MMEGSGSRSDLDPRGPNTYGAGSTARVAGTPVHEYYVVFPAAADYADDVWRAVPRHPPGGRREA
jgi:hypothetical protein